jgi:hypothetical protein
VTNRFPESLCRALSGAGRWPDSAEFRETYVLQISSLDVSLQNVRFDAVGVRSHRRWAADEATAWLRCLRLRIAGVQPDVGTLSHRAGGQFVSRTLQFLCHSARLSAAGLRVRTQAQVNRACIGLSLLASKCLAPNPCRSCMRTPLR